MSWWPFLLHDFWETMMELANNNVIVLTDEYSFPLLNIYIKFLNSVPRTHFLYKKIWLDISIWIYYSSKLSQKHLNLVPYKAWLNHYSVNIDKKLFTQMFWKKDNKKQKSSYQYTKHVKSIKRFMTTEQLSISNPPSWIHANAHLEAFK